MNEKNQPKAGKPAQNPAEKKPTTPPQPKAGDGKSRPPQPAKPKM